MSADRELTDYGVPELFGGTLGLEVKKEVILPEPSAAALSCTAAVDVKLLFASVLALLFFPLAPAPLPPT